MERGTSHRPLCAGCGEPIGVYEPLWLVDPPLGARRTNWLQLKNHSGELWHAVCAESGGVDGG